MTAGAGDESRPVSGGRNQVSTLPKLVFTQMVSMPGILGADSAGIGIMLWGNMIRRCNKNSKLQ
jgi:hypothetical protein